MLQVPFRFPERSELHGRGRQVRERQRHFESRFAQSFAEMRARKQIA